MKLKLTTEEAIKKLTALPDDICYNLYQSGFCIRVQETGWLEPIKTLFQLYTIDHGTGDVVLWESYFSDFRIKYMKTNWRRG